MVIGVMLGAAVAAWAQYVYPGIYLSSDLLQMNGNYASVYVAGVVDGLTAQQFHLYRGGGGQKHVDKAYQCLVNRRYEQKPFSSWLQSTWKAEPNRNAALMMIDRCQR